MKRIPLTQGQFALIDDDDLEIISGYTWHASYDPSICGFYAITNIYLGNGKQKRLAMHRLLLNAPKGIKVDHRNRKTLDNQKANLRLCTDLESACNTGIRKDSTTGYRGVYFEKSSNRYKVKIRYNKKQIFLGRFNTAKEASEVYEAAAKKLHKQFYYRNAEQVPSHEVKENPGVNAGIVIN